MDDKDLFWLAGLLEGEGSFFKPMPSEPNRPRITLEMTDLDTIQRVNQLFGQNYIHVIANNTIKAHWKTSYRITFRGKRAVACMQILYPLMGIRRKWQIESAIGKHLETEHSFTQEQSFFWLVGYLEGEGSFVAAPANRPTKPSIRLNSTDEDIVRRASEIMKTTYSGPYKAQPDADPSWKLRYMSVLFSQRAIALMQKLRPHMSARRQQQIAEALASYQPKGLARGERHGQSKLTSEQVSQIKARLHAGEKLIYLAREYGVDQGLIWQIKAGRIWHQVD
ncbi:MAG: hypothetical protein J0M07_03535 [Anaerolineae bacterium]|nr:hypothetical protein [Anaerolineae bacterium]